MHDLHSHLTTDPLYLLDPIRLKYGEHSTLPPTTDKGSYPIDSIFVSPELYDSDAGGWLPISSGISDHRALYFDINISKLIGKYKQSIRPYKVRRLKCGNDISVTTFNRLLSKQYQHQNTMAKLEHFRHLHHNPLTPSDKEQLFKLDRVCTQAVLYAENHCRKIDAGGRPYTPELNRLGHIVDTWRLIVKKKLGRNISTRTISRAALAHNLPYYKNMTLQECINERAQAYQTYRTYAKQAEIHRNTFFDSLSDEKEREGNTTVAKQIQQKKLQEECRRSHRNIKLTTKDFMGAPYKMELKRGNDVYLSADKNQIEKALVKEYDAKYKLAHASPFLQQPLARE